MYDPSITCPSCSKPTPLDAMPRNLPVDHFECGVCRTIFTRRHGQPIVYPSGFVMPGKITIEKVGFECLSL
jgi:hypothetical protein